MVGGVPRAFLQASLCRKLGALLQEHQPAKALDYYRNGCHCLEQIIGSLEEKKRASEVLLEEVKKDTERAAKKQRLEGEISRSEASIRKAEKQLEELKAEIETLGKDG